MSGIRFKVPPKCECGKTAAADSVFCPHCMAGIKRENARMIKNEDSNYQKVVRGNGKGVA